MRNRQLERSLRLLRLLQRGRITLEQCARTLGVSKRTIQRDIEVLSVTGFPIERIVVESNGCVCITYFFIDRTGRCPLCDRPDASPDVTRVLQRDGLVSEC